MPVVNLGLDLGSTGLRAACAAPGETARPLALPEGLWPWPLCEAASRGPLPVAFSSLKGRLGDERPVRVDGVSLTARDAVTRALTALRVHVERETSAGIGHTVISVPARYESVRRTALRDAARAAGFGDLRLISDSLAAAVGHTEGEGSGTLLVYGMGHSGYELGLVRGARGYYRALGYEGGAAPAGAFLDAEILAGALAGLRRTHMKAVAGSLDEAGWAHLAERVQRLKAELGAATPGGAGAPEASGGPEASGEEALVLDLDAEGDYRVQFAPDGFAEFLRRHLQRTLERADSLFDQVGLEPSDVDTVLLVGGSTAMTEVRRATSALAPECVTAAPGLLAHGAALHAERLSRAPHAGSDDRAVPGSDESFPEDRAAEPLPPLTATVLTRPEPDPAEPETGTGPGIEQARKWVAEGRVTEARELLVRLVEEARDLLAELPPQEPEPAPEQEQEQGQEPEPEPRQTPTPAPAPEPTPPASAPPPAPTGPLAFARALLADGKYEQAIGASHRAWNDAPDRPDVFLGMIDIHCEAAMADLGTDHFPDAERWLQCANSHDLSNPRVRAQAADRTYLHAAELARQGRTRQALKALEKALVWVPDHDPSRTLQHRLTVSSARPKRGKT